MKFFLFSAVLLLASTAYAEEFFVSKIEVEKGERTEQKIDALQKKDNADKNDNWDGYIEFAPNDSGDMLAIFTCKVEALHSSGELQMHIKGESFDSQEVKFFIRNFDNKKYELLGNNIGQESWLWTAISLPLPLNLTPYRNKYNKIKIKIFFQQANEPLLIDQFVLSSLLQPEPKADPELAPEPEQNPEPAPAPEPEADPELASEPEQDPELAPEP
ncbi:MAG: hypothetical protein D3919_13690, partial [Candidatus Electrothrix sp. AW5]|nr:hypothetical protein [Candidatus Electrothrix gigas]